MSYDVNTFVSLNQPNVNFSIDESTVLGMDQLMAFEDAFASLVVHNAANDSEMPMMVYEQDGVPVAWYDMENLKGYVTN